VFSVQHHAEPEVLPLRDDPLGLVVVGGLLFSQLVTLYLTPVVYTYMAQLQTWMKARQGTADLRPIPAK
jgi:Cu/Ag efflux pump CusA